MQPIHVSSEIAPLKTVVLHTPGPELDQMTPETAEELLYDDILNMEAARAQHLQLEGVLKKVARPLQVKSLLHELLKNEEQKQDLIQDLCQHLEATEVSKELFTHHRRVVPENMTHYYCFSQADIIGHIAYKNTFIDYHGCVTGKK